jgi:2-oxoisovalerate dehydrogenase E1 component alpha subunit
VFVICNNQWAISVPRSAQTAAQTLAQKAIAAGFSGEQIDGGDVIAVRERVAAALNNAREKHEPSLLEIICYRQSDHTTADDASRYETKGIRETEWEKEPIARLRRYLENLNAWTEAQEIKLQEDSIKEVDAAVAEYLSTPPQPPESMFDYLYAELPAIYADQREEVKHKEVTPHG